MTSKLIFDHPALLEEAPLVDLTQATKLFPIKCSRATIERFIRQGSRGVKLATVMVGGRRYTTENAIRAFLVGQQHTETESAPPRIVRKSRKELDETSKRFGLPEPQKCGEKCSVGQQLNRNPNKKETQS